MIHTQSAHGVMHVNYASTLQEHAMRATGRFEGMVALALLIYPTGSLAQYADGRKNNGQYPE